MIILFLRIFCRRDWELVLVPSPPSDEHWVPRNIGTSFEELMVLHALHHPWVPIYK